MQIKDINQAIMFGSFTNTELMSIIDAVKFARANLTRSVARSITIGSDVKFRDRNGRIVTGRVEGIKIKNAVVNIGSTRYRVPMSMLEAA
jgi:hypothetical protein